MTQDPTTEPDGLVRRGACDDRLVGHLGPGVYAFYNPVTGKTEHGTMPADSVQPCRPLSPSEHARVQDFPLGGGGMGYIYAPYMPVYYVDCRPWWRAMWGLTWWRNRWDALRARFGRRRSFRARYAKKKVDPSLYRKVDVRGDKP